MPVQMRRRFYLWRLIAAVLLPLLLTCPAWAADYIWLGVAGGGDGSSWSDADNWDSPPGIPGAGDTVRFNSAVVIDVGGDRLIDEIIINSASAQFSGGNLATGTLNITTAGPTIAMSTAGETLSVTGGLATNGNSFTFNGNGNLSVQGSNTLTGGGAVTLGSAAVLYLNGNQTLYMPTSASHGAGTEINLSNSAVLTIHQASLYTDYQGVISGNGSFRKQGGGNVQLSGTNTYSGSTTVDAGWLIADGAGNQMPASTTLTVNSPAGFEIANGDETVGSVSGDGTLDLNAGLILSVVQAGNTNFSGLIVGSSARFTKAGAGTLTLTGTCYSEIRANGAALVFNGTAERDITSLSRLMGIGTCKGSTNIAGGYFAPGNSIGTFNANGGFWLGGAGTVLEIEVSGTASDRVNVIGTVLIAGAGLEVIGTPTIGTVFTIINNDGVDVVVPPLQGAAEGATITSGGHDYRISYVGGDGNDVTLTALTGTPPAPGGSEPEPEPEPSGPDAPSLPQGSGPSPASSLDGITLSWTKVKGATYYQIYRADCPTCPRRKIGGVQGNSFIDNTAAAGQPYYYWLRSGNGDGLGGYSNWMAAWRYEQNPGRAGDFNGDGIMDLLWWDPVTGQLSIWFMNGGAVQKVSAPGEGLDIAEWLLISLADFNGDGACDLLWWKPETGELKVWFIDKAKAMASGAGEWLVGSVADLEAMSGHALIAYPGDLNGDGFSDIIWRDYSNGQVTVWLMGEDGKPQLNGPPIPASEDISKGERPALSGALQWQVAGLGDANANGKSDVIWKDARNNRLVTWLMDGANILQAVQEDKCLDTVCRLVGVGDLNMDRQADIVWRNEANGAVHAWLMQAGAFREDHTFIQGSEAATLWQVKGVGDFCSPGCDDVYCKHSESNEVKILTLDGREFTPTVE